MHHTPEKWIFYDDVKEITVVIGEKSVNREFTSKHSQIYKGYTLVSFDDENFKPQDKEFQEPIGITKPFQPHPIFKIDNGRDIEINSKNKAWWLIESDSCPLPLNIKLVYSGNTNHPGFFDYESITVSYLIYSKDNKLEETKKEVLKSNGSNGTEIF